MIFIGAHFKNESTNEWCSAHGTIFLFCEASQQPKFICSARVSLDKCNILLWLFQNLTIIFVMNYIANISAMTSWILIVIVSFSFNSIAWPKFSYIFNMWTLVVIDSWFHLLMVHEWLLLIQDTCISSLCWHWTWIKPYLWIAKLT